jgi:hypothetical protein
LMQFLFQHKITYMFINNLKTFFSKLSATKK